MNTVINFRIKELIEELAAATPGVLKKAFSRNSEGMARNFAELGKPMGGRTVRKMMEQSPDVTRRNILANTVTLLGASRRQSLKTFERVWLFLESVAAQLRGHLQMFPTIDEQFAEYRYRAAAAERAYFRGNIKEFEQALIYVDHSLKGLFAKLQLID